ncbi:hypothetical protein [Spirillospora sp. NPDC047279]|uniref:hypothetical protein n=1 Tax=Spirillospora sp. NPDC047279 TaxID=3155478 RepID=UPI0033FACA7B
MLRASLLRTLVAASTVGAGLTLAPAATAADTGRWKIAHVHDWDAYDAIDQIVTTGPANAWAFGQASATGRFVPTAERWNGTSWEPTALPPKVVRSFTAAEATGPNNVWAFSGGDQTGRSYAIRWNGKRWIISRSWPSGKYVSDAAVLSPRDVWVFGSSGIGAGIGTWHYDGTAWSPVDTPIGGLGRASAVAADDIWAVGGRQTGYDLLARWDGTTWSAVEIPGLPQGDEHFVAFHDVHAASSKDVWIAGSESTYSEEGGYSQTPLALHFDGTTWERLQVPDVGSDSLHRVEPDGRGGVYFVPSVDEPYTTPALLRHANGRWTKVRPQRPGGQAVRVNDVAAVPRSGSLWAVGEVFPVDRGGSDSAIWVKGALPQ